ncbi:hypothetical protein [uncultured Sphaerochaeta sp.]|uniref:hypothetical protein n=1 Tax=uncultured Sphaerochaeta sp. TaxID=886478 RepID=UPI002A0A2C54|nr:hypothetical protein [uncultured Sphaerochaeta sp.]
MEYVTKEEKQIALRSTPGFLSADATLEQIWQHFYELGCLFAKYRNYPSSLGCFIDTFLIRGNEIHSEDREWIDFFRHQFSVYLLGKKNIACSLCEGDMIHDFLKDEYIQIRKEMEESEIPFCCEDLHSWFTSFDLDFPWELDDSGLEWSIG